MIRSAGTAELIRSHQKDDFYLLYLRNIASDAVHSLVGPSRWLSRRRELDVLADVGYFALTTLAGFQTIGEEYVNIIQVDITKRALPSQLRRVLMICLHVCTPYCLQKLFDWLERQLRSPRSPYLSNISADGKEQLLRWIPVMRHCVTVLHRWHLALFYLRGVFYHLAKRIAGVQYVQYSTQPGQAVGSLNDSFRRLGWLLSAQLAGSLLLEAYQSWQSGRWGKSSPGAVATDNSDAVEGFVPPNMKCSLCLEVRKHTTATPCGHLFCWHCIHEWCQTKAQCPLCREQFAPHRLILVQNFDPT